MKKNLLFLFTILIISGFIIAEGINVTFPRSGNSLYKNSSVNITWTTVTDCTDTNIKINIFRNSISEANFVEQLTCTNNGSKRWTISDRYEVGNYQIRVKTADNVCKGDSGVFRITLPPTIDWTTEEAGSPQNTSTPKLRLPGNNVQNLNRNLIKGLPSSIKINYPKKETNWRLKLGNTALPFPIRVQWEKTGPGSQDSHVKIILFRKVQDRYMRKKILLTPSTRNTGLFTGRISRDLRSSMYTIIIQTLDGKIRVESEMFQITNAENDPH